MQRDGRAADPGVDVPDNGLIFRSLPGSRTWRMELTPRGVPDFIAPNELVLPKPLDAGLNRAARTYWHPQPDVPWPARPAWILNTCADADDYARAIQLLDEAYPGTPIFNHPRAVMAARRDIAGLILKNIPGLEVPRCKRFRAAGPQSFAGCFNDGSFRFPVTMRRSTARNGLGQIVIADPPAMDGALLACGGAGRWHLMVQADGREASSGTTLRIVVVGRRGTVLLLRRGATDEPADQAALPPKELLQAVMKTAIERMPLDYWTMDVRVLGADQLRLVDVCPGLPIPARSDGLPHLREQALQLNRQLAPRLLALLAEPAQWRGEAQDLPSVAAYRELHGA